MDTTLQDVVDARNQGQVMGLFHHIQNLHPGVQEEGPAATQCLQTVLYSAE